MDMTWLGKGALRGIDEKSFVDSNEDIHARVARNMLSFDLTQFRLPEHARMFRSMFLK